MARVALLVVGVLVLVLAAGMIWLATLDPNQHKATIEGWASDALGTTVRIGGPIALTRGLTSTLVVNDLAVSGAQGAGSEITIQRAEISVALISLLRGPLHLPLVTLDTATLDLPLPALEGAGRGTVPRIDRLEASNIEVRYRQNDGGLLAFKVARAAVTPSADETSTALELTATVAALPLSAKGTTGPVAALFAGGQDLPLSIEATLAGAVLDLTGSLGLQGGDLAYSLDSKLNLPAGSKLAESFSLPALPLAASAKLEGDRSALRARGLAATWGGSDLAGDLTWQVGQDGARGKLSGKATSRQIVPGELGLLSTPGAEGDQAGDVVPNPALPGPAQVPLDLDLSATIAKLDLGGGAATNLTATVSATPNTLDLSVGQASLGGGTVQGRYRVDGDAPDVAFAIDTKAIDLASLFAQPKDGSKLPKDVSVKIDLTGQGADLHGFLGSANGAIAIDTGEAVLESKFADTLGRSLFTSIIPGVNSSGRTHILCAVLDLEAKAGKARSTALVIDGRHTVVGGGGAIDLASGKIDFVLLPVGKNATIAPLVTPVHLDGTIADPQLVGDAESILGSTSHLLLGIVNPLSLATPVLHPDLQGEAPCRDPTVLQGADPIGRAGGTAIDAVKDTAKGVGSAIEALGKGAGELLEDVTGN